MNRASCPAVVQIVAVLLMTAAPGASADTHYVSKTGSNTYPYDSWATATDSIVLAVDAAGEWDTVRLAAGEYTADTIGLKKGLAFIGAGRDSTHILHNGTTAQCVYLRDSCLLQGIYLQGRTDTTASGIVTFHLLEGVLAFTDQSAVVKDCRFSDMEYAFQALWTDLNYPSKRVVVEDNEFSNFFVAVRYWFCSSRVLGNTFVVNHNGIGLAVKTWYNTAEIRDNTFIRTVPLSSPAIQLGHCDSIWVANNMCLSSEDAGEGISVNSEFTDYPTRGVIENNLCLGAWGGILTNGGDIHIRNNIISRTTDVALFYFVSQSTPGNVGYNLYWENGHKSAGDKALLPDPGNLFANPMFVDSLDFHLQAFSPAIDAGDPSLLDADGTRSDIGPFGGPYGETYVYPDLPPLAPRNLYANSNEIVGWISWSSNDEADLDHYELFRDTQPIVIADSNLLIASLVGDTQYVDSPLIALYLYYRVRAVDAQGHAGGLSNEDFIVAGAVDDGDVKPDRFELHQNYPNPFNAQTRIEYSLPVPVRVTLVIYDVLGRKVTTLAEESQTAGYYSLTWDAKGVGSGVYFLVLSTPTDRRVQKALLLK